jgi:DNA-binding NarL/FixJ family response regulator
MPNIAIIEDNADYRKMLKMIIENYGDMHVVLEADNCIDILPAIEDAYPELIIMDIDLPGKSGIEAVWEIKQAMPDIKILMLTVIEDEDKIFGAIKAGANGYLLKKDKPQKIIDGIEETINGHFPMNGLIATKVMEYFRDNQPAVSPEQFGLTKREKEILGLLNKGMSYKQIADTCFISVETLNSHIKIIYQKLNVHSRSEIAALFGKFYK